MFDNIPKKFTLAVLGDIALQLYQELMAKYDPNKFDDPDAKREAEQTRITIQEWYDDFKRGQNE